VLISVESLSAHYLGAYGSKDGLTPRLDALARNGVVFNNLFATGTRTVRGLDALSLSTPPIPGQAIMRRPHISHLNSVGEMLSRQNFQVYFFYGGHGYFDNMNTFFRANSYDVRDRASIPSNTVVFENVWGVADETLFSNTLAVLDNASSANKPMFAHIMTTSNHRPYTYPDGRIDIPSPGGRHGAVKYTDYALGQFIDKARAKPWFKDTLFVIVADHCASVAGKTDLPVAEYKIPLIFYGPDLLKPARIDRMISQIDIAPTLFRILGAAGSDNFFGQDVLEQKGAPRAFISTYEELGYYKNNQLIVLKPMRVIEGYTIDPVTLAATPAAPDPTLTQEAIAYYQTASRAFKRGELELLWPGPAKIDGR
jgi:phosphoglycerol transferase MdoB-like AlkP superfamily enzyme